VNDAERKERRVAWTMLILCPLSMAVMFAYVTMGYAPGLTAGAPLGVNPHPPEYLQMTCLLWAMVMTVLPVLRLARLVALPYWFTAVLYANMYLYVISLCMGMYLNISWWGDATHVVSSAVIASIVFMALCLMQAHSPPHVNLGARGGLVMMLIPVSVAFGLVWEVMEGFTDIITGMDYMSYGASYTLYDILADVIGASIIAVLAWFILGKHDAKHVACDIRVGKRHIDSD
jgi:hypothetical protein